MNWVSIIISLISSLFTIFVFFYLDRRIKVLEKEKLEYELLEYKRAKFQVDYQLLLGIHPLLNIKNIGRVMAQNITIELQPSNEEQLTFDNGDTNYLIDKLDPTEDRPHIKMTGVAPNRLEVLLIWDDESGKRVSQKYYLTKQ